MQDLDLSAKLQTDGDLGKLGITDDAVSVDNDTAAMRSAND